jgi:uncharacterized protein (TIGR02271 family)
VQNRYYDQVHEGMDVLDTDGEKIGKCGETLGEYFNVDAGFLGTTEYYVPFSAITDISEDQIFLNVRKDQLDSMGWKERPSETTTRTTTTTTRQATTGRAERAESDQTLQLREEQLRARTTPVETGSVRLGKDVVEEQRTVQVPVTREEVYVERHPVERRPTDEPIREGETETIRVPVTEERVEVEKQPVVYEEVGLGKRVSQETQQVSDTVRREELRTEREGDVEVRDQTRDTRDTTRE